LGDWSSVVCSSDLIYLFFLQNDKDEEDTISMTSVSPLKI